MFRSPLKYFLLSIFLNVLRAEAEFLKVVAKNFFYKNRSVYLSGVNIPVECISWRRGTTPGQEVETVTGCDFGNGYYNKSKGALEGYMKRVANAGGNSIRMWVHVEGQFTPEFDKNGFVTATDSKRTLTSDLEKFLDFAATNNIFVLLTLWNGAEQLRPQVQGLLWDDSKLTSYIENALKPMVRALKGRPALAAWEVMNEPEGFLAIEDHPNPCYNTTRLSNTGAGWAFNPPRGEGKKIPMERISRFLARMVSAIHSEDKKALVTVGSSCERPITDAFSDSYNYYKDDCMVQAGGSNEGKLDFFQVHTYTWEGKWAPYAPFKVTADAYKLDRPLVIGEYSSNTAAKESPEQLADYAYNKGYRGAFSYQYKPNSWNGSETQETSDREMRRIRNARKNGYVKVIINNK